MPDERGRQRQRDALLGGVDAKAAHLIECQRRGTLPQEKLELLAYCGHAPAQAALGNTFSWWRAKLTTFARHEQHEWLSDWVAGLERWGRPIYVRVVWLLGQTLVETLRRRDDPLSMHPRIANATWVAEASAVSALADWLRCPCQAHRSPFYDYVEAGHWNPPAARVELPAEGWPALSRRVVVVSDPFMRFIEVADAAIGDHEGTAAFVADLVCHPSVTQHVPFKVTNSVIEKGLISWILEECCG